MAGGGSFFPPNGTMIVPWYATGFRGDRFEAALNEVAAVAMRYGASSYAVYRARDDRYKLQQLAVFADPLDWERYWEGPEMIAFRARHVGWYQVPVLYGWWDRTAHGDIETEPAPLRAEPANGGGGNGVHGGNGALVKTV